MKKNKIAGVYKITNIITGDFYIGSSCNIKRRWTDHKSPSKWKLRSGMKLYQAFIKYGLGNFIFEVLEETTDLHNREQYYIEKLNPSYNNYRAQGWNTERYKESTRRAQKTYRKNHRDKYLARMKDYCSRLCLYEGETLTLNALSKRFRRQGIANPCKEAKSYLIET